MHAIQTLLAHNVENIERLLVDILRDAHTPWVEEITAYAIAYKGKRLRAYLVLLLGAALGKPSCSKNNQLALIIEMLHAAMLLHDDVLDNSAIRRNTPTVHTKWNTHVSILMGDYIYAQSFKQIHLLNHPEITGHIAESCSNIVLGEIHQNSLLHNPMTTLEDYLHIIDRKTGELFSVALKCSALLIDKKAALWAETFGKIFGRIYQISDDLIDILPENIHTNKNINHDIMQGTVTLPTLLLMERMSVEERGILHTMIENPKQYDQNIYATWLDQYHIIHSVQEQITLYTEELHALLYTHLPQSTYRDALSTMIHHITERIY